MADDKHKSDPLATFRKRWQRLKDDRSHFMDYWGELSDYHLGHRGRFLLSNGRRKPKRNTKQYNNTSRLAVRTLASGMMAGITSPARPWFKLTSGDGRLDNIARVRRWLDEVEKQMYKVYGLSNTYNQLHTVYGELGVFGVAAIGVYSNPNTLIDCKTYTIGSYALSAGTNDRIDTFYREYTKTVGQLVKDFGIENVSNKVKEAWEKGNTEELIECIYAVEPNDDRDMMSTRPFNDQMPFRSVNFEVGAQGDKSNSPGKFLRSSGMMEFPILTPRWDVVGEDVYSEDCPGMISIGDTKALQLGERRFYQALDKIGNPPLEGDLASKSDLGHTAPNPGEIVYRAAGGEGLQPIYKGYLPRVDIMREAQNQVETRINEAFYKDLFLMLHQSDRRQITAREVAEKHEEKLLMLGPVLERLHTELLDPLIDRTFYILQRSGVLPPPPQELLGRDLDVEYVSVLAQAQRLVGLGAMERAVGFAANLAQLWPEARHKIDPHAAIDEYASDAGVPSKIIRSDDEVARMIQQDQIAAAQQQQLEQANLAADTQQKQQQQLPIEQARQAGLI